jgi:hypothetical protein
MFNIPYRQEIYVPMRRTFNDFRIVVDKHTTARNVQLFANYKAVKIDSLEGSKTRNKKKVV